MRNSVYCTTLKKGLEPFFYKALQKFAAKTKDYNIQFFVCKQILTKFTKKKKYRIEKVEKKEEINSSYLVNGINAINLANLTCSATCL